MLPITGTGYNTLMETITGNWSSKTMAQWITEHPDVSEFNISIELTHDEFLNRDGRAIQRSHSRNRSKVRRAAKSAGVQISIRMDGAATHVIIKRAPKEVEHVKSLVLACVRGHIFTGTPYEVGRRCPRCDNPLMISQESGR